MVTFLTCDGILVHQRSKSKQLMNPASSYYVNAFPYNKLLTLYVEITGGRGTYLPELSLSNSEDQTLWEWNTGRAFSVPNPLITFDISFNDLCFTIPHAGRYLLSLQLNKLNVAQRSLWFDLEENR